MYSECMAREQEQQNSLNLLFNFNFGFVHFGRELILVERFYIDPVGVSNNLLEILYFYFVRVELHVHVKQKKQ